jgi:hypothetical protein
MHQPNLCNTRGSSRPDAKCACHYHLSQAGYGRVALGGQYDQWSSHSSDRLKLIAYIPGLRGLGTTKNTATSRSDYEHRSKEQRIQLRWGRENEYRQAFACNSEFTDRVARGGHSFLFLFCTGQFPVSAAHVDFHIWPD